MLGRTQIVGALGALAYAIALMTLGAQALALYLIKAQIIAVEQLRHVHPVLSIAFWIFAFISSSLNRSKPANNPRNVTPRQSGIAVVLVTGMIASTVLARSNGLLGLLIAALTLTAAAAVWRFATAYESEIGEARFPNSASRG